MVLHVSFSAGSNISGTVSNLPLILREQVIGHVQP